MRKLLAALAVMAVLLVVADFGAAAYAENRVSQELRTSLSLEADPDVRINGVPFLTQAVSGTYSSVQVEADGVPVPNLGDVSLAAVLHGVHLPLSDVLRGDVGRVQADSVEASVRIGATTLGQYLRVPDLQVSTPAGADPNLPQRTVVLTGTVSLLGISEKLSIDANLALVAGGVAITATGLDLGADGGRDSLAEGVLDAVLSRFSVTLDASSVPFGITPTQVRVEGTDLVVEGSGTDVTVVGGPSAG